jgi:hypothetical protein
MKVYRTTYIRSCRTVGDLCGSQSAFRAPGLSQARSVSDANVCGTRRPKRLLCRTSRRLLRLDCINLVQGLRDGRRPYAVSIRRRYALAGPNPSDILGCRCSRLCARSLAARGPRGLERPQALRAQYRPVPTEAAKPEQRAPPSPRRRVRPRARDTNVPEVHQRHGAQFLVTCAVLPSNPFDLGLDPGLVGHLGNVS